MKKSTKNLLYVIGLLSIIAGIYSYVSGGDTFEFISALFIGVSLIGTVYFDKSGK